ncbi:MAG: SIR2 family protein [Candidatus Binatia bacterium]
MRLQAQIHFLKPWSVARDRSGKEVVFVLGAGASRDAQLPLADDLTRHWRGELVKRVEGAASLLEAIDRVREPDDDGRLADDYEQIFWWLQTLWEHRLLRRSLGIDPATYDALFHKIRENSRDIIADHLSERQNSGGDVAYLSRFAEFATERRAVKVFTLNYDTCVERACRSAGSPIVTGFDGDDERRRGWQPAVFDRERAKGGVHLYKLHGSLSWFGSDPNSFETVDPPDPACTKSHYGTRPRLILGPTSKVQSDDPCWWLLNQLHATLKRARACVVIGFRGRDPHVGERIAHERSLGLDVIEVGPDVDPNPEPSFPEPDRFKIGARLGVDCTASHALTTGRIHAALRDLDRLRTTSRDA